MKFSKELYSKIALMKSAYAFTDRAYIHLDADDQYYYVGMRAKSGQPSVSEDEFINEMLCQSVRHEVYCQTKDLRELLVARALASTVIRKSDDANPLYGEESDDDAVAASILSDWFDEHDEAEAQ